MKEIILSFDGIKNKVLDLGHSGDTGNIAIKFDCVDFFKGKETKNAKLLISKPDGTNTSEILTVEDGIAVYVIGTGITDVSGFGAYQLKIDDGTNVLHYPEGKYFVGEVINESEPPTPPTPTLTGRTFLLNETPQLPSSPIGFVNVVFSSQPPVVYHLFDTLLETDLSTECCGCHVYVDDGNRLHIDYLTNESTPDHLRAYENEEWSSEGFRTIRFVSEPIEYDDIQGMHYMSTEETIAWLAENATEITE